MALSGSGSEFHLHLGGFGGVVEQAACQIYRHIHQLVVVGFLLHHKHTRHKHGIFGKGIERVVEVHLPAALGRIQIEHAERAGARVQIHGGTHAQHGIARHFVLQLKFTFHHHTVHAREQMIVDRHAFQFERHTEIGKYGKGIILHHRHGSFHTFHGRNRPNHTIGIGYGFAGCGCDGNVGVHRREFFFYEPMKAIEHTQHTHQRSRGHHHPQHRDNGDNVHRSVPFFGTQIAIGNMKRQVAHRQKWALCFGVVGRCVLNGVGSEQIVDVLNIVERIVDIEIQFRHLAQLIAHALRQVVAHRFGVGRNVVHNGIGLITGKHAQIHPSDAQVGRHSHGAHTHQHAGGFCGFQSKNFAQLFLE